MHRMQIQLTDEQREALRRIASERGVSTAAVIRELLDKELSIRTSSRRRAVKAVGGFRSGRADVSEQHDRDLVESFES